MTSLLKLLGLLLLLQFIHAQECEIEGVPPYYNGEQFIQNCMSYTCAKGHFITSGKYKPQLCSECLLANDPHITTFEEVHYDYHKIDKHVVAEGNFNGKKSVVSSKFSPCTQYRASATCIETVYFKPNNMEHLNFEIIILKNQWANPDTAKVEIDGYSQSINDNGNEMQVLKGGRGGQQEYPVLAYWVGDTAADRCLQFTPVDTNDFMVKVCSSSIKVYVINGDRKNVVGLCNKQQRDLRSMPGVIADPGGRSHIDDATFGNDRKNGLCTASKKQMEEYINICKGAVGNHSSLTENKRGNFIADCAFDRCIIIQAGGDDEEVEKWLSQWPEMVQHELFEEEHSVVYEDDELEFILGLFDDYDDLDEQDQTTDDSSTPTPAPVISFTPTPDPVISSTTPVPVISSSTPAPELTCPIGKEFKARDKHFAFFYCPKNFTEARDFCKLFGWTLASPDKEFKQFNKRMPGNGEYYLNIQPDKIPFTNRLPMTWYWQIYTIKTETKRSQWMIGNYNHVKLEDRNFCASLFKNDGLLACKCEQKWFFACESINSFNVPRSVMEGDEHAKELMSSKVNFERKK